MHPISNVMTDYFGEFQENHVLIVYFLWVTFWGKQLCSWKKEVQNKRYSFSENYNIKGIVCN